MNGINFKCSECHQSLEVDMGHAGTAVACPECGQTILVPQLARLAQPPVFPETPERTRSGWRVALSMAAVLFLALVAAVLLWPKHGGRGAAFATAPGPLSTLPDTLTSNLVLYFSFAKPPAGSVPDLSGRGNDGEAINVQWVEDSQRGGCIQFGMTNSYIRVPDNDSLNPANLTLAAWIKTSFTDAIWRRIFDKGYGKEFDLTMGGDSHGKSWQGQAALEVVHQWAPSGVIVADGSWHQVAGTFDGSVLRFYVDGHPVGSPHRAKGQPEHAPYDLTIGQDRSIGHPEEMGQSFNGMMDDVMMFNRALTPREVQTLYNFQRTAPGQ